MKNHNMHDLFETLAKKNVADCQLNSAIYDGQIRHRRFAPRENKFTYQLHMLALDVDEVAFDGKNNLIAQGPFGYAWFYPMRFCEKDYVKGDLLPLRTRIENKVRALGHEHNVDKIIMLVQVRCFGFYFSPANFYFCYDNNGECDVMLAEVSNTPWNQRHYYLVNLQKSAEKITRKNFHVSPFMKLAMSYHWRIQPPSKGHDNLLVHIDNQPNLDNVNDLNLNNKNKRKKFFDVTLTLKRREITAKNLFFLWIKMPVMTMKIVGGIYWQALKLFIKRIPFISYQKPDNT